MPQFQPPQAEIPVEGAKEGEVILYASMNLEVAR
jgi:hypothetical protein